MSISRSTGNWSELSNAITAELYSNGSFGRKINPTSVADLSQLSSTTQRDLQVSLKHLRDQDLIGQSEEQVWLTADGVRAAESTGVQGTTLINNHFHAPVTQVQTGPDSTQKLQSSSDDIKDLVADLKILVEKMTFDHKSQEVAVLDELEELRKIAETKPDEKRVSNLARQLRSLAYQISTSATGSAVYEAGNLIAKTLVP